MSIHGRCLCGAIQYEINGAVGPIDLCHCSFCRRASGSAFASNASVAKAEFSFVSGEDELREYEASPGKFRGFCSRCGSPIYARHVKAPDLIRIRCGSLEDDPQSRPQGHYDVASKAHWYEINDGLPQSPD